MFRNTISLPGLRKLYLRTSSVSWPEMADEAPWAMICTPSAAAARKRSDAPTGPPWLSNSTSCSGSPFQPPAALMRSSSYLMAARNIWPVEACGPDSVSIKPIFTGAAWAAAARPATHSAPAVRASFIVSPPRDKAGLAPACVAAPTVLRLAPSCQINKKVIRQIIGHAFLACQAGFARAGPLYRRTQDDFVPRPGGGDHGRGQWHRPGDRAVDGRPWREPAADRHRRRAAGSAGRRAGPLRRAGAGPGAGRGVVGGLRGGAGRGRGAFRRAGPCGA